MRALPTIPNDLGRLSAAETTPEPMKLARDTQALERGHLDNPTNVTRGALRRYLTLVLMLPVFLDGNAWDSRSNHVRARGCSVLAADVGMRCYHPSLARRRTTGG